MDNPAALPRGAGRLKVRFPEGFFRGQELRVVGFEEPEVYSPETVRDLRTALRSSWDVLRAYQSPLASDDRRDETRAILARRLLKCAATGETNNARLVTYALEPFV